MLLEDVFEWFMLVVIFGLFALAVFLGAKPDHRFSKAINAGVRTFWRSPGFVSFRGFALRVFLWGVVIVGGGTFIGNWLTPEKDKLAQQYHVSKEKIVIDPKPHGCDFDDAPLGSKHCHFEKNIDVERTCPGSSCGATGVYVSWRKVDE